MTDTRTCACCPRTLRPEETGRHACHPCEARMRGWLLELPTQLIVLRASVMPERGAGIHVASSRTAPIPARLDVLSLLGPAAPAGTVNPTSPAEDQIGDEPIHETLYRWAARVRDNRDLVGPAGLVPETLAEWLEPHLDWASRQPWVATMYADLGTMMHTVRGITRAVPRRRPIDQPCPRCESMMLTEVDHQLYRECGECGSLYTADELALAAAGWLARDAEERSASA